MSSGKVHARVTITASILISMMATYYLDIKSALALLIGGLIALVYGCDLDVDNGSRANYYMRKLRLNWLFVIVVSPYSIAYKHRSKITHFPILSSTFRLIYLYLPLVVIPTQNQHSDSTTHIIKVGFSAIAAQVAVILLIWFPTWFFYYILIDNLRYILFGVLGLIVSDLLHWVMDQIRFN